MSDQCENCTKLASVLGGLLRRVLQTPWDFALDISDSQVFAEARDALTEIHTQQKWPEWTDGTDDPRR